MVLFDRLGLPPDSIFGKAHPLSPATLNHGCVMISLGTVVANRESIIFLDKKRLAIPPSYTEVVQLFMILAMEEFERQHWAEIDMTDDEIRETVTWLKKTQLAGGEALFTLHIFLANEFSRLASFSYVRTAVATTGRGCTRPPGSIPMSI